MKPLDKKWSFYFVGKEAKMKEKNKEKAELGWAEIKHVFCAIYREM